MAKFSKNVILDLNRSADESGGADLTQAESKKHLEGFKEAFNQFAQGGVGWSRCSQEEWGGQGMPKMSSPYWQYEMIWSTNPSFIR